MTPTDAQRRVGLLDPCPLIRCGLAALCDTHPELLLVISTESAAAFRRQLDDTPCDVVVMDITCPQTHTLIPGVFSLLKYLQHTRPTLPVILWCRDSQLRQLYDRMYQHPWIWVSKWASWTRLASLLRWVGASPDTRLIPQLLITLKERRILQLYLLGYTSVRIGQCVNRSAKTVSSHKFNVLKKIGLIHADGRWHIHPVVLVHLLSILLSEPRCIFRGNITPPSNEP